MPTLTELRRATADRLAPFELVTTGARSPAGTYSGTEIGGSARRVVSSDLVSIDALGVEPESPLDYLKNEWAYLMSNPPEQRRIPELAFVGWAQADETLAGTDPTVPPTSPVAYVDCERPFSAVVAPGLQLELHAFPPLRGGRSMGIHAAVNKALRVMLREDTLQVTAPTGQYRIDISLQVPWLVLPDQLVGATWPETTPNADACAIPGARVRFDADAVILTPTPPLAAGSVLPVRVLRPLSSWIKPASTGTWGESSVGLVADGDACLGDMDAIAVVAAFYLAEERAGQCRAASPEAQYWLAKAASLAARSAFLRDQRRRMPPTPRQPWPDLISPYGPLGGRYGPGFR